MIHNTSIVNQGDPTFAFITVFVFCFGLTFTSNSVLASGQNEIQGFQYQDCLQDKCLTIQSAKAWLSMADGSFTTANPTTVQVLNRSTGQVTDSYNSTGVQLLTGIETVSIDLKDGDFALLSTKNFKRFSQ